MNKEIRSLVENFMLPGIVLFLPWKICFRIFRFAAKSEFLYKDEAIQSVNTAKAFVRVENEKEFKQLYKLHRIIDHADVWLNVTRNGNRFIRKNVSIRGNWPPKKLSFVGVFYHWGPHFWAVKHLRASVGNCAMLIRGHTKNSMGGARSAYWYGTFRLKELTKACGQPLIYAPGSVRKAVECLGLGSRLIGMPDIEPQASKLSEEVMLFDRKARMASGLVEIARRAKVPIVLFRCEIDIKDGHRCLIIDEFIDPNDPRIFQAIAGRLEKQIRDRPWAYFLWPIVPTFFEQVETDSIDQK